MANTLIRPGWRARFAASMSSRAESSMRLALDVGIARLHVEHLERDFAGAFDIEGAIDGGEGAAAEAFADDVAVDDTGRVVVDRLAAFFGDAFGEAEAFHEHADADPVARQAALAGAHEGDEGLALGLGLS